MRAAIYIDAGTTKAAYVPRIYDEVRREHEVVLRKAFGCMPEDFVRACAECRIDCTNGGHAYGTEAFGNPGCAEVAMAVEIMSDVLSGRADIVFMATGNPAFIPVVDRLRLAGVESVVIGSCGTPRELVAASAAFRYSEVIAGGVCTADTASIQDISDEIYAVSSYYKSIGGAAGATDIYRGIVRRYPDFDVRNYGYAHFATFVKDRVRGVTVRTDENGETLIQAVDSREDIEKYVYSFLTEKEYKIDDMAELLAALAGEFPGFDMSNYGYHTDYGFILSFPRLEIYGNKGVKLRRSFKLSERKDEEDTEQGESPKDEKN